MKLTFEPGHSYCFTHNFKYRTPSIIGTVNRQESFIHLKIFVSKGELNFTFCNKIVNRFRTGDKEKSGDNDLNHVKRRLEILYPERHKPI